MPGPVRQSNLVFQAGIDASAINGATINGVESGNTLVAIVVAHRPSSGTGNIVSGYATTIGATPTNTWTLIARAGRLEPAGVWYSEVTAWIASNVAAGNTVGKPTFSLTDALTVFSHMDEWSGIATSSPVDKTATADESGAAGTLTVGPTGTLSQASEVVIGAIGNRYNYSWTSPSGFTVLQSTTDNSTGNVAQSLYREVSATTSLSATWSYVTGYGPAVGVLFTLKQGTTTLRLEVDNIDADITGTTGWTFWAWPGDPLDSAASKRWTSYSATLSSGKLVFPDAPSGAAENSTWNVMGYQPSGTLTTGFMSGTVRAAT